ncbi:AIR synthase related protein [Paenibacillus sp. FSL K6-4396]|uniref:thiamine-phosphate kinase n=1 Tax=unclassified Paenibacillus TaxID=185978 RepID=UPI001785FFC9|nr:AIR synthase related protein [Paenibacillus sp. CFBP 13594]MBD8839086.1 hypothetical protein [Paenibacillus sp. CFBP 13594]
MSELMLKEYGEKRLIEEIIIPMINPMKANSLAGDDCAVIPIGESDCVTMSTDRVPADLLSYELGLINDYELGYYLASLNISDIYASGSQPYGILLNLAFNKDMKVSQFTQIMEGAKKACEDNNCLILGGDLSDSVEMNLAATSIGKGKIPNLIYRSGSQDNDYVFATKHIGITPTSFKYFTKTKGEGFTFNETEEEILKSVFKYPLLSCELSRMLSEMKPKYSITCMDNTDGVYQSLHEIAKINDMQITLDFDKLQIHPLSWKITEHETMGILDLVFNAGADFQLIGTLDKNIEKNDLIKLEEAGLYIIGRIQKGNNTGAVFCNRDSQNYEIKASGWNYYI